MIASITGNLWRALALALCGLVAALWVQIHGLPIIGGGLVADLASMTALRKAEADNHRATKDSIRKAMADAQRREVFRLARVRAEQERESTNAEASYNRRFADLRAHYDRLRGKARTGAESAAGGQPVPGLPAPAFGADAAPGADRLSLELECSANALQLDELITWVERQAAIDPNEERK